jgi:hypothetical protein
MQPNDRIRVQHVIAVATHISEEGAVPLPWIIEFLKEIDSKFPGLTFRDFCNAVRLCDAAQRLPWGTA